MQILAIAYRQDAPFDADGVADLIEIYSKEERWRARRNIAKLAQKIREGVTLPDALEQVTNLLSDEQVLSIRLASQTGTLSGTLEELIEVDSLPASDEWSAFASWPYYLALTLAFCLLVAFIQGLIAPTFVEMFAEFGMQLPRTFQWSFNRVTGWILWVVPTVVLTLIVLMWTVERSGYLRRLRRSIGSFLSREHHALNVAKTLEMLSQSMQAGRPAGTSLSTLARYHFDSRVRMQLLTARNDMDLGTDLLESCRNAGLLNAELAVALGQLEDSSDRGWLVKITAQRTIDCIVDSRRLRAIVLHAVVIGGFASLTLLICLGMFSSLTQMINSLT